MIFAYLMRGRADLEVYLSRSLSPSPTLPPHSPPLRRTKVKQNSTNPPSLKTRRQANPLSNSFTNDLLRSLKTLSTYYNNKNALVHECTSCKQ